MSDLQNDEDIIYALDVTEEEREDLIYSRIFPYYRIPNTTTEALTYILVEINIRSRSQRTNLYSYPTIIFTILAHQSKMPLHMAGISSTRIDYLGELIDNKYNGSVGFGIGKLELVSNIADNLDAHYRYRQLIFQGVDLNDRLCGD